MVTDVSVTCISFYGSETPLPFRRQRSLSLYPSHLNLTISLINLGCLHRDLPVLCQTKPATCSKVLTTEAREQPHLYARSNPAECSQMRCNYTHHPSLIGARELLLLEFLFRVVLRFGRDQDVSHSFVTLSYLAALRRMGWREEGCCTVSLKLFLMPLPGVWSNGSKVKCCIRMF